MAAPFYVTFAPDSTPNSVSRHRNTLSLCAFLFLALAGLLVAAPLPPEIGSAIEGEQSQTGMSAVPVKHLDSGLQLELGLTPAPDVILAPAVLLAPGVSMKPAGLALEILAPNGLKQNAGAAPGGLHDGPAWRFPFPTAPTISRFFEQPESRYGKGHRGIDFASSEGSPILAPAAGTVHFAGTVAEKPAVSVRVDGDIIFTFEPAATDLSVGDVVTQGDTLARVAVGGHCDGSCVHFGVRVSGEYVNPLRFLAGRPILLPLEQ